MHPQSQATDGDAQALLRFLRGFAPDFIAGMPEAELLQRFCAQGVTASDAGKLLQALAADPLLHQARATAIALRKRNWLLDLTERHRALAPAADALERRGGLSGDQFLREHYAACRPVILTGEMADWPALSLWTLPYLRERVGGALIEYQGGRNSSAQFEQRKDDHRRELPFDRFLDLIAQPGAGNDAYITAYNSGRNAAALAPLYADLRPLEKFLDPDPTRGMPWIGPAGTFTPLHHDLTNNLIVQVVGRKQLRLVAAGEAGKLGNRRHVFSEIGDLDAPGALERHPQLRELRIHDVTLLPGEMLYVPIGWWHQVRSLDFSVTYTYTSFRWRNDWHLGYPQD